MSACVTIRQMDLNPPPPGPPPPPDVSLLVLLSFYRPVGLQKTLRSPFIFAKTLRSPFAVEAPCRLFPFLREILGDGEYTHKHATEMLRERERERERWRAISKLAARPPGPGKLMCVCGHTETQKHTHTHTHTHTPTFAHTHMLPLFLYSRLIRPDASAVRQAQSKLPLLYRRTCESACKISGFSEAKVLGRCRG